MYLTIFNHCAYILIFLQDWLQNLQDSAQDLIELKMLFDVDLKLALAKDLENPEIHMIQNLVNDVFGNNQAAFP